MRKTCFTCVTRAWHLRLYNILMFWSSFSSLSSRPFVKTSVFTFSVLTTTFSYIAIYCSTVSSKSAIRRNFSDALMQVDRFSFCDAQGRLGAGEMSKCSQHCDNPSSIQEFFKDTAAIIWNSYFAVLWEIFARSHFCVSLKRWTLNLRRLSLWSVQHHLVSSSA